MKKIYLMAILGLTSCAGPTTYYTYFPNPTNRLRTSAASPKLPDLPSPLDTEEKLRPFAGIQSGYGWVDDGNVSQATIAYGGLRLPSERMAYTAAPFVYLGSATKEQKPGLGIFLSAALMPPKDTKWSVVPQLSLAYSSSHDSDSGCDSKVVNNGVETCSNIAISYQRESHSTLHEVGFEFPVMNKLDGHSNLVLTPAVHFSAFSSSNSFNLNSATDFNQYSQGWNYSLTGHYEWRTRDGADLLYAAGLGLHYVQTYRAGDSARDRKWMPTLDTRLLF